MYRQPSRWERQILTLESSAQKGKFDAILSLYSSEYRKLKLMGFNLEDPVTPYNNPQNIKVDWRTFRAPSQYCFVQTEGFHENICFADECFIKAFHTNLAKQEEPSFNEIIKSIMQ